MFTLLRSSPHFFSKGKIAEGPISSRFRAAFTELPATHVPAIAAAQEQYRPSKCLLYPSLLVVTQTRGQQRKTPASKLLRPSGRPRLVGGRRRWRLFLLHVLLLLFMALLQLLGLLLMTLLYLLPSRIIGPLLKQSLVILLLFLLKSLAILLLLGVQLLLLLLVLLIYLGVARVRRRRPLMRRKFARVNWWTIRVVRPNTVTTVGNSVVACADVVSLGVV